MMTPKTSISSEWESSTFHARKVNARTHIGIVQPSCTSVAVLDYLPAVGLWMGWCVGATLRTHHQAFLNSEFSGIFSGRQPRQDVKLFPTYRELPPSPSSGCAGGLVLPSHLGVAVCPEKFPVNSVAAKDSRLISPSLPTHFKNIHSY